MSALDRVVVGSPDSRAPERVAFVEAIYDHAAALKKVAAAIAALEYRSPSAVEERLYNIQSAQECVEQGISDDVELRVFETGWNGRAPTYVEQSLILVAAPATLIRAWYRCPHEGSLTSLGDTRR